jgi:hypothetical protein
LRYFRQFKKHFAFRGSVGSAMRQSAPRLIAVAIGLWAGAANADLLTLTFDVNVLNQFNYATQTYNAGFQGFSTTMTVIFDDAVSVVEQDPNDTLIGFGTPLIYSPLTATLPYGPAAGQTLPSSEVALANRDYSPSQQWSELAIVQSEDNMSGATTWAYDFELDSGSTFPLIPSLLQDSSAALYQQLLAYQQNSTPFTFSEFAQEFDSQTGQSLAGTGYSSTATLVNIQESPEPTPEPSTFAMLAWTAVMLGICRMQRSAKANLKAKVG